MTAKTSAPKESPHFSNQAAAMRHHGVAGGGHKRHPATSHYKMGVRGEGNRYRRA